MMTDGLIADEEDNIEMLPGWPEELPQALPDGEPVDIRPDVEP